MKKTYLSPAIAAKEAELLALMNASIAGVGGNSGIQMGDGETPTTADSRRRRNVWDDEELDEEENW